MSLATRCPVCTTAFRVRAEQLAARGGRVRCGQCSHVFDGVTHLVTDAAVVPPEVVAAPDTAVRHEVDVAPEVAAPPRVAVMYEETGTAEESVAPREAVTAEEAGVPAAHASPDSPPARDLPVLERHPAPPVPDEDAVPEFAPPQAGPSGMPDTLSAPSSARSVHASVRRDGGIGQGAPFGLGTVAPPPVPAPVPRYRLLWGLIAVLALAALAAQAAWRYRTELGVLWPDARPYLEAACEFAGCTLRLPRHADLLAIESSDLQRDPARENFIVLNAVLRNRAQFPQEFPALELTLTDEASNAVVRRVLQPADYLDPRGLERAQAEGLRAGAEARLSVHLDASRARASGYQLYLFYP